jgi:hypothetical protein
MPAVTVAEDCLPCLLIQIKYKHLQVNNREIKNKKGEIIQITVEGYMIYKG